LNDFNSARLLKELGWKLLAFRALRGHSTQTGQQHFGGAHDVEMDENKSKEL
jgi:hypothetical protein